MEYLKIVIFIVFALIFSLDVNAQGGKKSFQINYYEQRRTLIESLPDTKNEIIFLSNSITDGGEWAELFRNRRIKNRGISGDVTEGILFRLNEVTESNPSKVFLLIGINDLARGISKDTVYRDICRIAIQIQKSSSKTKVYIQSILLVNPDFGNSPKHSSKTEEILWINQQLKDWCAHNSVRFIDLLSRFKKEINIKMNPLYTNDGLHLNGEGYILWAATLKEYL